MDERLSKYLEKMNASAITDWALGRPTAAPPWLVYICPTNICNLRCVMCARARVMRPQQGTMDEEIFRRIVHSLPASVKKVYLMKQGEPLVHPRLEHMAEVLKRHRPDVHLSLHTNALLLTPARFRELGRWIDSLGISISAITPQHYKAIHGRDRFAIVMKNLEGLQKVVGELESKPYIFIDYVRLEANKEFSDEQVVEFFSRFRFIDSVDIHCVHSFQGAVEFADRRLWEGVEDELMPSCVFPWCSMTVLFDGKVGYCFVESEERVFLGELPGEGFEEIWNGPGYQRFRSLMAARDFSQLEQLGYSCRRCSWLWDLKANSPRSLVGGYSLARGGVPDTGELLKSHSLGEGLQRAVELYEQGEVVACKGWLEFMAESLRFSMAQGGLGQAEGAGALELIEEMRRLCEKVLQRYVAWERIGAWIRSKGGDFTTRYYPLS